MTSDNRPTPSRPEQSGLTANQGESPAKAETNQIRKTVSSPPPHDLEKTITDVMRVEGNVIAFSMLALAFLLTAISVFNQTNFELARIQNKLYGFIPLGPTMQYFILIIVADVISLLTGLVSRIVPGRHPGWKFDLITISVASLIIGLVFFTLAVWDLRNAFFYWY